MLGKKNMHRIIKRRILLQRLVSWAGRKNIFHPAHYGFMPFKDCTAALSKFYDDISNARTSKRTALAVCLDIMSAYDSVWIDCLIYKLAALGVRGKMGRWIANFLTDRSIRIRWKSVLSDVGSSSRGVPQGCVLSPFLYMIFMADLFEILLPGVFLIIYADDIFLYAIGEDPTRTLAKLQDCLDRLVQWCTAHHLAVSPDKSVAINFSRRRNFNPTINLIGQELVWSPAVKILGVWFSKSLKFNYHFSYIRAKAFKRLNYVKYVVSSSRGVGSAHMLQLVNSLIRSLLEFACPLFLKSCPSSLNAVEVIYNAALRVALGLPMCTPIPLLRREANASSMESRFRYLTHSFLVRHLSLPHPPPFSVSPYSDVAGHFATEVEEFLSIYGINRKGILQFTWPIYGPLPPNLKIVVQGLTFQSPSLPSSAVFQAWCEFRSQNSLCNIVASDASKDPNKTAFAVYDEASRVGTAFLIPHLNSVFTAEALGLYTALSAYAGVAGHFIFLTDSLSTLTALQCVSLRSPRVILMIHNLLHKILSNPLVSISLIWSPGHSGIPPNEAADACARNGPYSTRFSTWIAPEDIKAKAHNDWKAEKAYAWLHSDYHTNFPHLTQNHDFRRWTSNRREDVWITRWRTRMWLTNSRLHKMKLTSSPLCSLCCVIETPDHALLQCAKFGSARSQLLSALGLTAPTYSDVLSSALRSRSGVSALVRFSAAVASA